MTKLKMILRQKCLAKSVFKLLLIYANITENQLFFGLS